MEYILGSGSPRRRQLLSAIGYDFDVMTSDVDETPDAGLEGADIAVSLAKRKAEVLRSRLLPDEVLITADTIVWINNELLGKPADEEDAMIILQKLNGNTHQVFTGVCIYTSKTSECFSCESKVTFKSVTEDFLRKYIATYKPFDKAGSYGAQECLMPGINYLDPKETDFLNRIGRPDLFEKTLAVENGKHVPLIDKIEGSYFNVMGLPIVELSERLQKFKK